MLGVNNESSKFNGITLFTRMDYRASKSFYSREHVFQLLDIGKMKGISNTYN